MTILLILVLLLCEGVAVAAAFSMLPPWAAAVAGGVGLIVAILLYRLTVIPARIVQTGFNLIASQDTNNRLRKTGYREADRVVGLFNSLMETLGEARLRMREQEQMFSKVMAAVPVGIVILDLDRNVEAVNSAFLQLGALPRDYDAVGKELSSLPSSLAVSLAELAPGETRVVRPEGRLLFRCRRLWFIQSGFRQTFYLVENLSEEVARAEKEAYGKVVRLISHEVNNNMAGFLPLLDALAELHSDDGDLTAWLESVGERSRNLGRFINGYADVVRLPEPHLARVELCSFLRRLHPFLESVARFPLELRLMRGVEKGTVEADAAMLEQALVNIVTNARQALERRYCPDMSAPGRMSAPGNSQEEPLISVSLDISSDGKPVLTVTNNGERLSSEQARMLFTPFYSSRKGGQGIGLTLTSEILARHGLHFTLKTDSDGLTRFRISW